jgi:hypothetical protein
VTDVRDLLGGAYDADDHLPGPPAGRPPLSRPRTPGQLMTGMKILDTLVRFLAAAWWT